jgi:hypothetical protein
MELTDEDFCNWSTWVMYRSIVNDKELYSKCLEFIITYAKEGQEVLADELDLFFEELVDERIEKQDLTDNLLLNLLDSGAKAVNWLEIATALINKVKAILAD